MRRNTVLSVLVGAVIALGYGFSVHNPFLAGAERVYAQGTSGQGQYASVNGLKMYYEIHGTGQPLVLLHGGLGGIVEFSQILPVLAKTRQVIAVELQGHGHTADIDRPLSFEQMADDIAALIKQLKLEKADILSFSLGGGVALQTVIRHPEAVRRLVIISTVYKRDGWYPETLAQEASMNAEAAKAMMQTPIYQFYASVAPKPEDWPRLVTKVGQLLGKDYDWSAAVAAIKTPTLIMVGDGDRVRPEHALEMVRALGGGKMDGGMSALPGSQASAPLRAQLAMLPSTTHFTILSRADLLLPIVTPFLDASLPDAK